jgi:hypothetical protein
VGSLIVGKRGSGRLRTYSEFKPQYHKKKKLALTKVVK